MGSDEGGRGGRENEVWITGLGLVSSLGEGHEAHWQALAKGTPPVSCLQAGEGLEDIPFFPICELDYSAQIPKRGDLRQMEGWQRIGTYAAGLALDEAGIKGDEEILNRAGIICAAGNGERDPEADEIVLEALAGEDGWPDRLNQLLLANLRPTLYLAQQTQLLAGNIAIVHKLSGGSRTFKGEEMGGAQIFASAFERIRAGQGDLFLVGAANNAQRPDLRLIREMNHSFQPMGSMGAFLMIESSASATSRGAKPLARLLMAGAEPGAASREREKVHQCLIAPADENGKICGPSRNPALMAGHGVEAQFPFALALALICLEKGRLYPPFGDSEEEHEEKGRLEAVRIDLHSALGGHGHAVIGRVEGQQAKEAAS